MGIFMMSEVLDRCSIIQRLIFATWLIQQVLWNTLTLGLSEPFVCHRVSIAQKGVFRRILGCCQYATFFESL